MAHADVDAHGRPVVAGGKARILAIPDWLTHDLPAKEVDALKQCEGKLMKVIEIDQHGYVWFGTGDEGRWFCLKPEEIEMVYVRP